MQFKFQTYFIGILFFVASLANGQAPTLSPSSEVILMTMEPGQEELYSAFGHSAFRIKDSINRIDIVYNYGIFDFDQPNFYLNFTKGKLLYKLGAGDYELYRSYYTRINRTIREQTLDLQLAERQSLFNYMVNNARPENADYYYNYCYDNCATKLRDVLSEVLGQKLTFDYSYADDSLSYRDLMDLYMDQQPWGDVGIDFCLGAQIDELASGSAYMYMPLYLEKAFANATITENDSTRALVKTTATINTAVPLPDAGSTIKPLVVFIVFFFLIGFLTHREMKFQINYLWLDKFLFGLTGLLGCFLLFLWFGTDHLSKYNYNLIWCTPLNLLAFIFLLAKAKFQWLKYYYIAYGVVLILLIAVREQLPQVIHVAFIPLVLALSIRSFMLAYKIKAV